MRPTEKPWPNGWDDIYDQKGEYDLAQDLLALETQACDTAWASGRRESHTLVVDGQMVALTWVPGMGYTAEAIGSAE